LGDASASVTHPVVEISTSGRGGSIYYREGEQRIAFDWEFALPPAIVLIFGPKPTGWDSTYPWASGRRAGIFDFVGAEVVRQQVAGGRFEVDADEGVIEILRPGTAKPARKASDAEPTALDQFVASATPVWKEWAEGATYDLEAIGRLTPAERAGAVELLTGRDVTWREVEALAALETPPARAAIEKALAHHLSIDTRLAAAEIMHELDPAFDLDAFLARQIRALYQPRNGLERALRLAEDHDAPLVRQALLWSSYNSTECAPACARLLLRLTGAAGEETGEAVEALLTKLGVHNSSFDRSAAFQELCRRTGLELDLDAGH
jgi:hypothetical protein